MPNKGKLTEQQVLINKFAFCLLKHFRDEKIGVENTVIKFNVDQLCGQDIDFLYKLKESLGGEMGLNIKRSGKGLCVILGVAQLTELPKYLISYKRQ